MTAPNTVQRRRKASDDLLAPCAEEGAQFHYRPPQRPLPARPRVWPTIREFLKNLALLVCAAILFATVFLAAMKDAHAAGTCDWSNPGTDRFTGDVPSAVDAYQDIPLETRIKLGRRMRAHSFDDFVTITATEITGRNLYSPELWAMHYGSGRICLKVTRAALQGQHFGLAYTEDGYTIVVPNDCGNVARATMLPPNRPHALAVPPPVPDEPPVAMQTPDPLPPLDLAPVPDEPLTPVAYYPGAPAPALVYGAPPVYLLPPPEVCPPVPESSTWLLMLAAILAVWLDFRVRRK